MKTLNNNEQVCSVCESQPEDMLILSCRHNLCLDCATEVYNLNSKLDKIVCEICLSDTRLDQDTIICLRSLSAKSIKDSHLDQGAYNHSAQQNRQNFPPIPRNTLTNYQKQGLPLIQQESQAPRCQKHHQPLTYYCLQCNFFKICSECMLLENHRFHKVVTLRKASIHIKDTIEKVGRQKLKLKNLLQRDRQSLIIRKDESQKQIEVNINQLKSTFDEITKLIMQKYEELKKKMEDETGRKLQIMQGAINQIQQKITLIQDTIQFQDQLVKSAINSECNSINTFQMFQYYSSEMSQNKVDFQPSLPNFISEVSSQKVFNRQAVFQQFQQILNHMSISSKQNEEQNSQQNSEENINYISQIENQNLHINSNSVKQKRQNYSMKKRQQQNHHQHYAPNFRKPISQNINIIQLNSFKQGPKQRKDTNNINVIQHSKRSKQSIQAIKRKARENIKDRQLSHSRKMQLSRSIQNANDILNKIQERSSRI